MVLSDSDSRCLEQFNQLVIVKIPLFQATVWIIPSDNNQTDLFMDKTFNGFNSKNFQSSKCKNNVKTIHLQIAPSVDI